MTTTKTATTKATKVATVPTPQAFKESLLKCETKLEVAKLCNELVNSLEREYAATTVRKNLTKYRAIVKPLHETREVLPELLTPQSFKQDGKTVTENQHCALDFLKISDETEKAIAKQTKDKTQHRAGESADSDDIAPPHTIDVSEVFKVAESLLNSDKPQELALALETFTGRRRTENFLGDFTADDDFTMLFSGQLKKRTVEDSTADYMIVCLHPSDILETVSERIKAFDNVKSLYALNNDKSITENCDNRFGTPVKQAFDKYFKDFFPKSRTANTKGSSHQLRVLYAQVLGHLYVNKRGSEAGKIEFIAANLGDSISNVANYTRFNLINVPEIPLQIGLKTAGQMPKLESKSVTKVKKDGFNMDIFLQHLDPESQLRFKEDIETNQQLEVILAKAYNQATTALNSVRGSTISPRKPDIENHLQLCYEAILQYNCDPSNTHKIAITDSVLAKIYERVFDKRCFGGTIIKFTEAKTQTTKAHHEAFGLTDKTNYKIRPHMQNIMNKIAQSIPRND